mgnify:CR=1 FL=1
MCQKSELPSKRLRIPQSYVALPSVPDNTLPFSAFLSSRMEFWKLVLDEVKILPGGFLEPQVNPLDQNL